MRSCRRGPASDELLHDGLVADDPDETALAARTPTSVDPYEQNFMAGEGTVLYRAKDRAHWSLAALVLGLGGVSVAALWPLAPVAAIASFVLVALTWLLFAVLRVTVSEGAVNIQLGLWGPRIPISSIVSVMATTYKFTQFGGWGIRISPAWGTMYNMPGDGGHALKIRWRDKGREKVTWVGTRQAEQLVRVIRAAQREAVSDAEEPQALDAAADSEA